MVDEETWENKCCRCEGDTKANPFPGKRACHVTCGPCSYPDQWSTCLSCEIVGHCRYALDYLKSLKSEEVKKGCFFDQQLTGEETIYHTLNFVNTQQSMMKDVGEKQYLEELKKSNVESPCLNDPKISCREIYFEDAKSQHRLDFLMDKIRAIAKEAEVPSEYELKVYKNVISCCGVGGASIIVEIKGPSKVKLEEIDLKVVSKVVEFCEKEGLNIGYHRIEKRDVV